MEEPRAGLEGLEALAALVLDGATEELEGALRARGLPAGELQGLFELAAEKGAVGGARVLARAGARPRESPRGAGLLGAAARGGDLAAFEELLAAGADVNGEAAPGESLLVGLCQAGWAQEFLGAALRAGGLDPAPGGRRLADWALEAGNWGGLERLEEAGWR